MSTSTLWDALSHAWTPAVGIADLPARAGAGPRSADEAGTIVPLFNLTILVVQDEPILQVVAETLDECGFQVVACRDAGEGLGAFALLAGPAVLVTDAELSGLPGPALAEAFCRVRPDAAAVIATRCLDTPSTVETLDGRYVLLRKPFNARELQAAVCHAAALALRPRNPRPRGPDPRMIAVEQSVTSGHGV